MFKLQRLHVSPDPSFQQLLTGASSWPYVRYRRLNVGPSDDFISVLHLPRLPTAVFQNHLEEAESKSSVVHPLNLALGRLEASVYVSFVCRFLSLSSLPPSHRKICGGGWRSERRRW